MVLSPQQKRIAMISLGVLVVLVIAGVGFFMMNRRKETPKVLQPVLQVTAPSFAAGKYLVFDENDGISLSNSQGTPVQIVNAVVNGDNVQQLQFKSSGQYITVTNRSKSSIAYVGGIVVQGSSTFQTSGAGAAGVSLYIDKNNHVVVTGVNEGSLNLALVEPTGDVYFYNLSNETCSVKLVMA
jgi:hypothetical protein